MHVKHLLRIQQYLEGITPDAHEPGIPTTINPIHTGHPMEKGHPQAGQSHTRQPSPF